MSENAQPTVAVLGGRMAPEGEAILEGAGYAIVSTAPYPTDEQIGDLFESHRPLAVVIRLVRVLDGAAMDRGLPSLRLIAKHGAGFNDIDIAAAAARKVAVIVAAGSNAPSVAEHALMLILALAKDLRTRDARLREGIWEKSDYAGFDLRGRLLGLVGFGQIAQQLAIMAQGLAMRVMAYDPYATATVSGVEMTEDVAALFERADVVSLHCPLTDSTRNLVNADTLARMKPTALLINTARGEVVDEAALLAALRENRIAGAGLDSFADEPPAADHPFWSLPNVLVTPHIAGVSRDARLAVSTMTARNIVAFLAGEILPAGLFRTPRN